MADAQGWAGTVLGEECIQSHNPPNPATVNPTVPIRNQGTEGVQGLSWVTNEDRTEESGAELRWSRVTALDLCASGKNSKFKILRWH